VVRAASYHPKAAPKFQASLTRRGSTYRSSRCAEATRLPSNHRSAMTDHHPRTNTLSLHFSAGMLHADASWS
jgi:hypothetical protein